MNQLLNKTKEFILDVLLPKFCVGCGKEGAYICKACEIFLSEVEITPGVDGKTPGVDAPRIVSVWEYEGLIEKLIYKIKFDGHYHIIDELAEKALEKVELNLPQDTVITWVPMWPKKERYRGFNQSELIARQLGNVLGLAEHNLLEKARDNRSQVGLGPRERAENVREAFRVTPDDRMSDILGMSDITNIRNVLVVDDIYTTGATMKECMKVLKRAGVKNVYGFTLARKLNL